MTLRLPEGDKRDNPERQGYMKTLDVVSEVHFEILKFNLRPCIPHSSMFHCSTLSAKDRFDPILLLMSLAALAPLCPIGGRALFIPGDKSVPVLALLIDSQFQDHSSFPNSEFAEPLIRFDLLLVATRPRQVSTLYRRQTPRNEDLFSAPSFPAPSDCIA